MLHIIFNIIISIIIVMIIHYLWNTIKNTYFVKYSKTKDLVNGQMQKYKKIIEDLQKEKVALRENPIINTLSMEEDLEKFMKENIS
jgi:hypothetical protein